MFFEALCAKNWQKSLCQLIISSCNHNLCEIEFSVLPPLAAANGMYCYDFRVLQN